ncbi:hypothetical protein AgCh_002053 [Apium graveolens]
MCPSILQVNQQNMGIKIARHFVPWGMTILPCPLCIPPNHIVTSGTVQTQFLQLGGGIEMVDAFDEVNIKKLIHPSLFIGQGSWPTYIRPFTKIIQRIEWNHDTNTCVCERYHWKNVCSSN